MTLNVSAGIVAFILSVIIGVFVSVRRPNDALHFLALFCASGPVIFADLFPSGSELPKPYTESVAGTSSLVQASITSGLFAPGCLVALMMTIWSEVLQGDTLLSAFFSETSRLAMGWQIASLLLFSICALIAALFTKQFFALARWFRAQAVRSRPSWIRICSATSGILFGGVAIVSVIMLATTQSLPPSCHARLVSMAGLSLTLALLLTFRRRFLRSALSQYTFVVAFLGLASVVRLEPFHTLVTWTAVAAHALVVPEMLFHYLSFRKAIRALFRPEAASSR